MNNYQKVVEQQPILYKPPQILVEQQQILFVQQQILFKATQILVDQHQKLVEQQQKLYEHQQKLFRNLILPSTFSITKTDLLIKLFLHYQPLETE